MLAIKSVVMVNGSWPVRLPIVRKSWPWWWKWIIEPAQINSKALNKACVIKWKKANLGSPTDKASIITPSCLKVDNAIIFFMSHSVKAAIPAINIVKDEVKNNRSEKILKELKNSWNRISKNTPAVTSVEEWTKAETGVGAAIAAGSQLEKGIWALFVIAAIKIEIIIKLFRGEDQMLKMYQLLELSVQAIATRRATSPIRLVRAVIIPAPKDLGFW